LTAGDLPTRVGKFDIDDVAELVLCEVGDPDFREIAADTHPFVVFGVSAVIRI
jgi:hypothetical protein